MAVFLFEDASTAVRNASMRKLLDQGAEPNDLRSLEDLVTTLARVPVEAWEDRPVKRRGHRGRRRRAAAELRERAEARGLVRVESSESVGRRSPAVLAGDHDPVGLDRDLDRRWPAQCSV